MTDHLAPSLSNIPDKTLYHGTPRSNVFQQWEAKEPPFNIDWNKRMQTNHPPVHTKVEMPLKLSEEDAILKPLSPVTDNQLPH